MLNCSRWLVVVVGVFLFSSKDANSFRIQPPSKSVTTSFGTNRLDRFAQFTILCAKKQKGGQGFGSKKKVPTVDPAETRQSFEETSNDGARIENSIPQNIDSDISDTDLIFQKYGIVEQDSDSKRKTTTVTQSYSEDAPFGQSVISKMSESSQIKIEQTLIALTFLTLSFCVLCGIAISFDAFKIVFPEIEVFSSFDGIITNFLIPAFTPSLGVFLLCSVTFGLFKFAQISSNESVYREQ